MNIWKTQWVSVRKLIYGFSISMFIIMGSISMHSIIFYIYVYPFSIVCPYQWLSISSLHFREHIAAEIITMRQWWNPKRQHGFLLMLSNGFLLMFSSDSSTFRRVPLVSAALPQLGSDPGRAFRSEPERRWRQSCEGANGRKRRQSLTKVERNHSLMWVTLG
jgi:hypothetical protein